MIDFLNIVCYKWGPLYSVDYVNKLASSVSRNLKIPHKFFCLTDDSHGLSRGIATAPIPRTAMFGNAPKLYTFSQGFLGLKPDEYVVSLDLDNVIVGDLSFLGEDEDKDFVIAKHRIDKVGTKVHGAVYRLRVSSHSHVWDNLMSSTEKFSESFSGWNGNRFSEQKWLDHCFRDKRLDFFPENKVVIFRSDCEAKAFTYFLGEKIGKFGLTSAFWGRARLPNIGEAIVSFAGKTKPADVAKRHHIHLKQAPFVLEHWRDDNLVD